METEIDETANEICNHFFTNCGATISIKDFNQVVSLVQELLAKHTLSE